MEIFSLFSITKNSRKVYRLRPPEKKKRRRPSSTKKEEKGKIIIWHIITFFLLFSPFTHRRREHRNGEKKCMRECVWVRDALWLEISWKRSLCNQWEMIERRKSKFYCSINFPFRTSSVLRMDGSMDGKVFWKDPSECEGNRVKKKVTFCIVMCFVFLFAQCPFLRAQQISSFVLL